jgi:hypothetical protein
MGAFDGYQLPRGCPEKTDTGEYFNTQSAFHFFEGFGLNELKALLTEAESEDEDTLWVPDKYQKSSGIGLSTWYVRALIDHHYPEVKLKWCLQCGEGVTDFCRAKSKANCKLFGETK